MKKYAAVATALCALALGATAYAGPEARDASGNYVVLDAAFNPAASSTKRTASAVVSQINVSLGNKKSGSPFPAGPDFKLTMPKGTVFNGRDLPQCPLARNANEVAETNRCGTLQRVGGGDATVDGRVLGVQDPIQASLTAYNGALHNGNPTLVVFAEATVGGNPIAAEIDLEWKNGALTYFDAVGDASGRAPYSFSSFNLNTGRVYAFKGKKGRTTRISLWEAPEKCPRLGWAFSLAFTKPAANLNLTARDTAPCVQFKD
jgi:hypothetical protein